MKFMWLILIIHVRLKHVGLNSDVLVKVWVSPDYTTRLDVITFDQPKLGLDIEYLERGSTVVKSSPCYLR